MTQAPAPLPGRDDLPGVERLLSLSDGVVAIALTLLVLQLKVPHLTDPNSAPELAADLAAASDRLISYAISFYVIGQFWLAHHRVFREIAGHREGLAWWNFAFLFTITVMPFTSNLLGEYPDNPLAVDIFALNLLLASLATHATLVYGQRRNLLVANVDEAAIRSGRVRTVTISVVVSVSIGLAWVNPSLAKYCWILIALAPWAASLWSRRQTAGAVPDGFSRSRP
jgi:TMEM175 potassium channel family protein